ncbi:MAG: hypothetical protein HY721_05560 [Planctomycetes bacterium]|nr:hypothetical protein [Planctomycetota bacterium]
MKLQAELKDTGFVIVAPHAQQATQEEALRLLRQYKVNYTVTSSGNLPGEEVKGLPMAFLFDTSGKIVEKGNHIPLQKVRDLVQSEPHFLAAGRTYTKQKAAAESLKKTKVYGQILKKLDKDLKGDGPAAEEARYLAERIRAHGQRKLDEAKAGESDDAFLAQMAYAEVAASWKGDEIGEKASARLKELKADKTFQEELKAATLASQILAECEKLVAQGGKVVLDQGPNQRIAANVKASATALKKKFPEAKATAKVLRELEGYGIKGL